MHILEHIVNASKDAGNGYRTIDLEALEMDGLLTKYEIPEEDLDVSANAIMREMDKEIIEALCAQEST